MECSRLRTKALAQLPHEIGRRSVPNAVGIRWSDTATDIIFFALVFWLIVSGSHFLLIGYLNEVMASILAFLAACVAGLLWRRIGRPLLRWVLRKTNISWVDDDPSALASIMVNNKYFTTQISVQLDDGTWLRCDELWRFADAPFGPYKIGPNGDVAMYLTHEQPKEGPEIEMQSVQDEACGDRISYIPASKIKIINFRHTKRAYLLLDGGGFCGDLLVVPPLALVG